MKPLGHGSFIAFVLISTALSVPDAAEARQNIKRLYPGDFINKIGGSELPVCEGPFLDRHQSLKDEVSQLKAAVVEVHCGAQEGFFTSGVYIDTPSKRLVLTVEHAVSAYKYDGPGKYEITHVGNPKSCAVVDPKTKELVHVDPNIDARMGHTPNQVSLDGSEDWMILPLQAPLTTAPLALATTPGRVDTPLTLAGKLGVRQAGAGWCANFTTCQIKLVKTSYRDGKSRPPYYYSNCSTVSGDSGGAFAMRDDDNRLVLAAIHTGSDLFLPPGSPWDESKMNSAGIGIGGPLLRAIMAMEEEILASQKSPAAVSLDSP